MQLATYVTADFFYWLINEAWREGKSQYALFINQETVMILMPFVSVFLISCTVLVIASQVAFFAAVFMALLKYTGYDIIIEVKLQEFWAEFLVWFAQFLEDLAVIYQKMKDFDLRRDPNLADGGPSQSEIFPSSLKITDDLHRLSSSPYYDQIIRDLPN